MEWQTEVVFFDDVRAMEQKAKYAKRFGLGGVMFWDASGDTDDHQLVRKLKEHLV